MYLCVYTIHLNMVMKKFYELVPSSPILKMINNNWSQKLTKTNVCTISSPMKKLKMLLDCNSVEDWSYVYPFAGESDLEPILLLIVLLTLLIISSLVCYGLKWSDLFIVTACCLLMFSNLY